MFNAKQKEMFLLSLQRCSLSSQSKVRIRIKKMQVINKYKKMDVQTFGIILVAELEFQKCLANL
jgi:hypothetical protein